MVSGADEYLVLEDKIEVAAGVASGTTTTLVVDDTDLTLVDDEHNDRWVYIVDSDGVSAVGDTFLRRITDVDAGTDTITFTPSIPAAPGAGAYVQVLPNVVDLTSKDWGLHTNGVAVDSAEGTTSDLRIITVDFEGDSEISPELGGTNFLHVLYRGAAASISDTVAVTPASTPRPSTSGVHHESLSNVQRYYPFQAWWHYQDQCGGVESGTA